MFNDISWGSPDKPRFYLCEKIVTRKMLGHESEKKWYSTQESKPQEVRDRVAELMMIKFRESGHPVFRATSPSSRGTLKTKEVENCQYTCADGDTIEIDFRTIISVNQISIYGTVSDV